MIASAPPSQKAAFPSEWLLVLMLMWPSVNYFIYYLVCCTATLAIVFRSPPSRSQLLLWSIALLSICAISAPKILAFSSASDIKELAKPVLFFTICLLANPKVSHRDATYAILFVFLVDLVFTILQWIQFDGFGFAQINTYLHPEHHIEGSLLLSSVRALGIFADTAEHASVALLGCCYFLANLKYRVMRRSSLLGATTCGLALVLAQSKTGFIAFLVLLPVAYFCIGKSFSKFSLNIFVLCAVAALYRYIPDVSADSVEQYYRLFELGLSVSSFDERQSIWKNVIHISLDSNPLLLIFGVGRGALEFHGLQSSVFDNDMVYLLNTYGVFGLVVIAFFYIYLIFRLHKMESTCATWLKYSMALSPLVGFATDFVSSLKILTFFGIAAALTFNNSGRPSGHSISPKA